MKKVALVFVLAVVAPSLVLAWLALRSLRDHQLVIERQETLLCQGVADGLAQKIQSEMEGHQRDFAQLVESYVGKREPAEVAAQFDDYIRTNWRLAEVGFVVSLDGKVIAPSLFGRKEARQFRLDNDKFLCNRESVEVYWNSPKGQINLSRLDDKTGADAREPGMKDGSFPTKKTSGTKGDDDGKSGPGAARFRQVVGDSNEGTLARFLQDQLKLLFWHRSPRDPGLVFGAQVRMPRLAASLHDLVQAEPPLREQICVALLDDQGKPLAASHPGTPPFGARGNPEDRPARGAAEPAKAVANAPASRQDWKHPFVSAEIGETLPHWEVAVYLIDPERLGRAATTARLAVGLLVGLLVLAIAIGSWLIVIDLRRQLALARQKTDFVSNVSHELKTPLTSIRMFSEMLSDDRVDDPAKRRHFLGIISAEAARLTRLINNVLDFARLERGEKKYQMAACDLAGLVRETVESYRPHLEAAGFHLRSTLPAAPVEIRGDRDALAQVLVNLISNAEKYSGDCREIDVELAVSAGSAEFRVLDRGLGVPRGCGELIFEQFYRAHDSLGSGIQGSGLGLTLARQIARAHGGDVTHSPRDGGGSCFVLRLPVDSVGPVDPAKTAHRDVS